MVFIVLDEMGKVDITYGNREEARKRAKEINGLVIKNFYRSHEVENRNSAGTHFEMEAKIVLDFRKPINKKQCFRED